MRKKNFVERNICRFQKQNHFLRIPSVTEIRSLFKNAQKKSKRIFDLCNLIFSACLGEYYYYIALEVKIVTYFGYFARKTKGLLHKILKRKKLLRQVSQFLTFLWNVHLRFCGTIT